MNCGKHSAIPLFRRSLNKRGWEHNGKQTNDYNNILKKKV